MNIRTDAVKYDGRYIVPTSRETKWIGTWGQFYEASGTVNFSEDQTEITLTLPPPCKFSIKFGGQMNIRTQDEIVADLLKRADMLRDSARDKGHTQRGKMALMVAERVLRVAAEQNSRTAIAGVAFDGKVIRLRGGK